MGHRRQYQADGTTSRLACGAGHEAGRRADVGALVGWWSLPLDNTWQFFLDDRHTAFEYAFRAPGGAVTNPARTETTA